MILANVGPMVLSSLGQRIGLLIDTWHVRPGVCVMGRFRPDIKSCAFVFYPSNYIFALVNIQLYSAISGYMYIIISHVRQEVRCDVKRYAITSNSTSLCQKYITSEISSLALSLAFASDLIYLK